MAIYRTGDTVVNLLKVRNNGVLTNVDPGMTAVLYVGGVLSGTSVTITPVSTGFYTLGYVVPASTARKELHLMVDYSIGGVGRSTSYEDQCHAGLDTADIPLIVDGVWDELMATHTIAGSAGAYQSGVGTTTITTADLEAIADYILRRNWSDAETNTDADLPVVNRNSLSWVLQNFSPSAHWFETIACMARTSGCSTCGSTTYCGCH